MEQQRRLRLAGYRIGLLINRRSRAPARTDLDQPWIAHRRSRDLFNGRREGCREEQRLTLSRHALDHAAHIRPETHVEHPVGLVQHQHLHSRKIDRSPLEVIDQPTRRRNDHRRRRPQRLQLTVDRGAAHQSHGANRPTRRQFGQTGLDLQRQLPRRRNHQRSDSRPRLLDDPVQNRQQKRGRLSCPGRRTSDHIPASSDDGDRLLLDRRRLGIT